MFGVAVPLPGESGARRLAQSAMCALAVGAMLGTLVAVPYDQLFGLSAPLCTVLRSSIATAILAGIRATDSAELSFIIGRTDLPQEGPK